MTWAEGGVWYLTEAGSAASAITLVNVDLSSFAAKTFRLPPHPRGPKPTRLLAGIGIFKTRFVVCYPERFFAVCDRRTLTWQYFPSIKPGASIAVRDGQVFMTVKDERSTGLLRYDSTTNNTEKLCDTGRVPPQSPLDDPSLTLYSTFLNEEGEVVVMAMKTGTREKIFRAWNPLTHMWRESNDELPGAKDLLSSGGFTGSGVLLVSADAQALKTARSVMTCPDGQPMLPGLPLVVEFAPVPGSSFSAHSQGDLGRDGKTAFTPNAWVSCPQGYIFYRKLYNAYRFWFLPKDQFDAAVKSSNQPP